MIFRGWQKTSLIEYPGKVATVLFTGGCNFRCPFCYNRDLVGNSEILPRIRESEVLSYLAQRKRLYQGVVVSGGEPTLHEGLPSFLREIRRIGLVIGIETNGSNPEILDCLIREECVDFVAMDVKTSLDDTAYQRAAGIRDTTLVQAVRRSIRLLLHTPESLEVEFRTTVVRSLHSASTIRAITRALSGARRYVLQQFVPHERTLGAMAEDERLADDTLRQWQSEIRSSFGVCDVRNIP